jgi:hypothetical protein
MPIFAYYLITAPDNRRVEWLTQSRLLPYKAIYNNHKKKRNGKD